MENNLRTVKDLAKTTIMVPNLISNCPCDFPCVPKVHIEEDGLRKMVIEWIKTLKKHDHKASTYIPHHLKEFYCVPNFTDGYQNEVDNLISWIMHFFNIKKEDLDGKN